MQTKTLTWNYICDNSKLKEIPEKEYKEAYDTALNQARNAAENKDMTLREYVEETYGYSDLDDYYDYLEERCENECYEEMLLYYILRYENLSYDDSYYESCVLEMTEKYSLTEFAEAEDFLLYYMGTDGLYESVLMQYVQDWIADQATVRDDIHEINSKELNK